ncbi:hypothetical protein KCQ_05576 [Pectobacterium atrosepticum ICMP 1526]|uniref:hypothetical protein n=1 Tax=Pectobacterium atrosepticum TaxID=29471 RepID=UPI00050484C7|nr:hypothetical protein [Pectobacterium atrosepticum]KFX10714.1 hypothetical protein JV34_22585 [Pectobacterium atrosepticum]KMK87254.1 hypothetical protein KCQ_05576 [Pectobacterium atrosepticum ICMP 1526]
MSRCSPAAGRSALLRLVTVPECLDAAQLLAVAACYGSSLFLNVSFVSITDDIRVATVAGSSWPTA